MMAQSAHNGPRNRGVPTVSLFSGAGGMDFGAEQAGAAIVFANDVDPDSCATLRQYLRAQVVEGDIRNIERFPDADLVIGGYPCQSFSMGGNRDPDLDHRTYLFEHFGRCLDQVQPKFFLAENVAGLHQLQNGKYLETQVARFSEAGRAGYRVTAQLLDAKDFGAPQTRRRMIIVGVRKDMRKAFLFPPPTHGRPTRRSPALLPYTSHGDAILGLPMWPEGEFYERPHDPDGHFSWYYMSRNRKAPWDGPSYTIVANWRHTTLHPAGPTMTLTWSNLADGWKQRWDFADKYEHLDGHPSRPVLKTPRRLSWRECALIQTFPRDFEPVGKTESKFSQIGNAVPPLLAKTVLAHLLSGEGLVKASIAPPAAPPKSRQMLVWS